MRRNAPFRKSSPGEMRQVLRDEKKSIKVVGVVTYRR